MHCADDAAAMPGGGRCAQCGPATTTLAPAWASLGWSPSSTASLTPPPDARIGLRYSTATASLGIVINPFSETVLTDLGGAPASCLHLSAPLLCCMQPVQFDMVIQ